MELKSTQFQSISSWPVWDPWKYLVDISRRYFCNLGVFYAISLKWHLFFFKELNILMKWFKDHLRDYLPMSICTSRMQYDFKYCFPVKYFLAHVVYVGIIVAMWIREKLWLFSDFVAMLLLCFTGIWMPHSRIS